MSKFFLNNREKNINNKKLKNFPTINFISLSDSLDRQKCLFENFKKYEITKFIPHIFEKINESECENIVDLDLIFNSQLYLDISNYGSVIKYVGAITSHLKAIKKWYESNEESYAIFCEDDLSFDTIKYWNFTWDEFFENLPKNWECIQLSIGGNPKSDIFLKIREPQDVSCLCYLIKKTHAKNLLDKYYPTDKFYLNLAEQPIIETIIYDVFISNSILNFPLFVENINFNSTVWNKRIYNQDYNYVINWWKEKGRYLNLSELKQ